MSEEVKIYHNPRCRKSREALKYLDENGIDYEVIKYLDHPPQPSELELLITKMNGEVQDIIRKEEKIFKEKFKGRNFNANEWLVILSENPKLIQRPIVVKGHKAAVGRPLENVKYLFN